MSRAHDHLGPFELSAADKRVLEELSEGCEPVTKQERKLIVKDKQGKPLTATLGDLLRAKEGS